LGEADSGNLEAGSWGTSLGGCIGPCCCCCCCCRRGCCCGSGAKAAAHRAVLIAQSSFWETVAAAVATGVIAVTLLSHPCDSGLSPSNVIHTATEPLHRALLATRRTASGSGSDGGLERQARHGKAPGGGWHWRVAAWGCSGVSVPLGGIDLVGKEERRGNFCQHLAP
jgi:hypothetical protein